MKIGRILFLMSALAFSQAGMANHQASDKNSAADKMWVLDVDKQLEYCHKQVGRALDELRQKDGSYDFLMEPRNILKGDRQKGWNCRKATPEEWCDGFWPGIFWMDYQNTELAYSEYESRLPKYTDHAQIKEWAKEPMAFCNALELIDPKTATTLAPNEVCTISSHIRSTSESHHAPAEGLPFATAFVR